jgi:4-methyl-5(b-hydroxyethyl)-thiazole monophosphate biosynthesis
MITKRVLVPLAQGCEELEAVTIIDLLRRARMDVVVAGLIGREPIKASRGVVLLPDVALDDVLNDWFDLVVLPGGLPGAQFLKDDARIIALLQRVYAQGAQVAAICAAPMVLLQAGLLAGQSVTAYPSVLAESEATYQYTGAAVELSGRVITSRGPGTAMDFALTLIEGLLGLEKRRAVEAELVR